MNGNAVALELELGVLAGVEAGVGVVDVDPEPEVCVTGPVLVGGAGVDVL